MNNAVATNQRSPAHYGRSSALSIVLVAALALVFLSACKKGDADAKPANVDYYTCTMHPSVRKQHPNDKCPICSMDLTPVMKKEGSSGSDVDYYTCTMHPSVKKQSPTDKCPICSMDLTPVRKKGAVPHVHGANTNQPAGTNVPEAM